MAKPKKTARPIVDETPQEPPATKRELSKSRLDSDLSERLGSQVKGRGGWGFSSVIDRRSQIR